MHDTLPDALTAVRQGLHDLAQPLTSLHCRLWLGTMEPFSEGTFRATLEESLAECERMMAGLRAVQEQVEQAMSQGVQ